MSTSEDGEQKHIPEIFVHSDEDPQPHTPIEATDAASVSSPTLKQEDTYEADSEYSGDGLDAQEEASPIDGELDEEKWTRNPTHEHIRQLFTRGESLSSSPDTVTHSDSKFGMSASTSEMVDRSSHGPFYHSAPSMQPDSSLFTFFGPLPIAAFDISPEVTVRKQRHSLRLTFFSGTF